MSIAQIYINKLNANYSSSFHFKIKIVISSSPSKESVENKHSFKYEKGSTELNIYEQMNLNLVNPLSSESKLQFFLQVYTKTGYKTAGVGVFHLSKGVSVNTPIKIEIKKCPLGKGYLEIQFLNVNIDPISKTPSKKINKIALGHKISKDKISDYSADNSLYSNNYTQNDISDISFITNMTNITNLTSITTNNNNINNSKQITNNYYSSNNQIKNKYQEKNSEYTMIDLTNISPKSNHYSTNTKQITTEYNNQNDLYKENNNNYFDNNNNLYNNEKMIKEKEKQINELKTKINDYEGEKKEKDRKINE